MNPHSKDQYKDRPWLQRIYNIRGRCNDKNHISYKRYGARGIKCFITPEQLKWLWFRDNAFEMKSPSLDRIDSTGHYEIDNCRFIELSENCKKNRLCIPVVGIDVNGNKRYFTSQRSAELALGIPKDRVNYYTGKNKLCGGYYWKRTDNLKKALEDK